MSANTLTPPAAQPKGGMCTTCTHRARDCSHLDFAAMPQIAEIDGVRVVRCTEYKRAPPTCAPIC